MFPLSCVGVFGHEKHCNVLRMEDANEALSFNNTSICMFDLNTAVVSPLA